MEHDAAGEAGPRAGARERRLTFVTDIVTPYMVAVFEALARRVHLSVVFCAYESGARGGGWDFGELPFRHTVVGGFSIARRGTVGTDYHLSPLIFGAIRRERPEVVVSAGWSMPTAYAAAYARLAGAGLVIHSDGTPITEAGMDPLQLAARRILVRTRATFAANSTLAAQRFLDLGADPEHVFLAPHSTALAPLWRVGAERPAPVPGEPLRVLAAGRLIPSKRLDVLIDAAARARAHGADVELVIAGDGPERAALESLAAQRGVPAEFLGFVDHAELAPVYGAANAFAFPSENETFGMVVLEAAAAGLPLLACDRAGATHDLVHDGATGFRFAAGDAEALAGRLVELAGDPALRERLGREAYVSTLERTPEASADGYVAAAGAALRRAHLAR